MFESPLEDQHEEESHRPPALDRGSHETPRPGAAEGTPESRLELEYLPWGAGEERQPRGFILATCGWVELEYAVMRRGCGMVDQPHRSTLVVRGEDRVDLLNRLVTQDLKPLSDGTACEGFLTDRTGRIVADLLLVDRDEELLIDLDVCEVEAVREILNHHIFSEDVVVAPDDSARYRVALHGPEVPAVLQGFGTPSVTPLGVSTLEIDGTRVEVVRRDQAATAGYELFLPRDSVVNVWQSIRSRAGIIGVRARTVGWYAFNAARLEGGTPLFNIDFGPTNLPHETSLIDRRVSFTKGCYPGQEVVARMHHRGQPKQWLCGFRMSADNLPVAGAQVFATGDEMLASPVGMVTSSAISPLGGAVPIGLAMLKRKAAVVDSQVRMHVDGTPCEAVVHGLDVLGLSETGS